MSPERFISAEMFLTIRVSGLVLTYKISCPSFQDICLDVFVLASGDMLARFVDLMVNILVSSPCIIIVKRGLICGFGKEYV